jgi:glycosyltransferase A (GT-A) superfamily protein (DUF2064 family)
VVLSFELLRGNVQNFTLTRGCGIDFVKVMCCLGRKDVSTLIFRLLDAAEARAVGGWVFGVVMVGGWYVHARSLRRSCATELNRVSNERNSVQSKTLGKLVKSSER